MRVRMICVAVGLTSTARVATGQTAVLAGAVFRDSLSHPLPGAEIWIPALAQRTLANALGDFRIEKLTAGRYAVIVRKAGFAPVQDSVTLLDGREATRDFVLLPGVQALLGTAADLPPVAAREPASQYSSPALQAFDARRKAGAGHFIDEEELRKSDKEKLSDVLAAHFTAIKPVSVLVPPRVFRILTLISTRGRASVTDRDCYVAVYLDGSRLGGGNDPVDMAPLETRVATLAGVEFYAAGAPRPAEFNAVGNSCGVLLLWSRER